MAIEPIELEFLLKDNMSSGVDKVATSSEKLGQKAEAMAARVKDQIKAQKEVVKHVERDLSTLEKKLSKMAPGKAHADATAEIQACRRALEEERVTLAHLEKQNDQATRSTRSLRTEQRELELALARMRRAGQEGTQAYRETLARAAELTDTLGDVKREINNLAHDNAGLQGVISGFSGLSGAMTAATGVMGIFIDEEEELMKMQTRLQSVMAITMGLQQLMDTLNKDSAFSTHTLRKAKDLLTSTHTRLTAAMWGSKAAATALMATLTLGISVAITAAIALYDRYNKAQEEAKKKAQELAEVERQGHAEKLKAQFELDNAIKRIKDFTGSKDEEKKIVQDLNNKYGDTFGYYQTMAQWYDTLREKSESYVKTLFLEAKAKSLIDKATSINEEYHKVEKQDHSEFNTWWGKGGYIDRFFSLDADYRANNNGKRHKEEMLNALKKERDSLIEEAQKIMQESTTIKTTTGLGGHQKREQERGEAIRAQRARTEGIRQGMAALREATHAAEQELAQIRLETQREGYDKEREALKMAYQRDLEAIEREEKKRLELIGKMRKNGATLDGNAEARTIALARTQQIALAELYAKKEREINRREDEEKIKMLDTLLQKHKDFDAERRDIEREYHQYVSQMDKLRPYGDEAQIDAAIAMARRHKEMRLKEIAHAEVSSTESTTSILTQLFEDASEKSIAEIKRIIRETEALIAYLNSTDLDDITATKGISKKRLQLIKESPKELESLNNAVKKLKGEMGKTSPLEAFFHEIEKGFDSIRKGGTEHIGKGIERIGTAVQKVMPQVQAFAQQLSSAFGVEMGDSIDSLTGILGNLGGAASGVGKLMAGDPLGGISAIASGIGGIISMSNRAREAHRAALAAVEQAQLDFERRYTLLLMKQRLLMQEASTPFGEAKVLKASNALKVYADAQREVAKRTRELGKVDVVSGHRRTGVFGWGKGRDTYSGILKLYPQLIKASGELDAAMLRQVMESRKIKDEHKKILQSILDSHELMEESMKQMDDYMGEMFGSMGKSATNALVASIREGKDALKVFAEDTAQILEKLAEDITYSLFFADKFKALGEEIKKIYRSGEEKDIARATTELLGNFYKGLKGDMQEAEDFARRFKQEASKEGFNLWQREGAQQGARTGAFTTMSQEQGTKLEGLFTSAQMHWASIDDQMIGITQTLSSALSTLAQIAHNTLPIAEIYTEIKEIKRDGIKIK